MQKRNVREIKCFTDLSVVIKTMVRTVIFIFTVPRMLERRGRPDATKLIVLLTDCGTTSQPPDTLEENVASITNDDINIFAIGDRVVSTRPR